MRDQTNGFSCIGYDMRVWPHSGSFSADATVWPDHEEANIKADALAGVSQNSYQLSHVNRESDLSELLHISASDGTAKVIGLEASDQVVAAKARTWGPEPMCYSSFGSAWEFIGFDVCDIDGLFSFLHMGVSGWRGLNLFPKENVEGALALTQAANILVPSHSPFVVLGLWLHLG